MAKKRPARRKGAKSGAKKDALRRAQYIEFKNADRAAGVAFYYGFTPLSEPPAVAKEDREQARELGERDEKTKSVCASLCPTEEKIALLRMYQEKRLFERPQPVMLSISRAPGGAARKRGGRRRFALEILGTSGSIAEAILIQTARAVLKEEGCGETAVALNSVGDRECGSRFVRELINFYRKNINDLPPPCRALLRKNPLQLLECGHDACRLLAEGAPKSIAYLSEASRKHFKEVLEFLEALAVPYRIDQTLIGNRTLATETVFEIREAKEGAAGRLLGVGMRYNLLARRLGVKRDVPSAGIALVLPEREKRQRTGRIRVPKPLISFLQLGEAAKLKSLKVIETLRERKIPLYHSLARDKIAAQMGSVPNQNIPCSIIMGQKEALENSVIVRDNATRAQETITIADLPAYLKKLKFC